VFDLTVRPLKLRGMVKNIDKEQRHG
jgi:hypothetical protein